MNFLDTVFPKAQAANKRLVLPEGHDPRVVIAASKIKAQKIATPIVLATPEELAETCRRYRLRFYSARSILRRATDLRANLHGFLKAALFFASNFTQEREVMRRHGLPNGGDP